jgi:chromosome segregation ATPase
MLKLVLSLVVLLGAVQAQDAETLAIGAKKDLEQALAELAQVRSEIEAERIPLVREVNNLERTLIDARKELEKRERFQDNQLVELNALKSEVKAKGDEYKYIDSLLTEYSRAFRTRINITEEPRFGALLTPIEAAAAAPDLSEAEKITRRIELLRISLERIRDVAGGHVIDASAAAPDGKVVQGKAALLGPVAVFATDDGQLL